VSGLTVVLLGAALLALAVGTIALVVVSRRRPTLEIHHLDAADARRYQETFAAAERDFEARPQVAIAQARGIVEEVLRRMGFPDRVDASQKARDLAAHDPAAAAALEAADRALREGSGAESLARALAGYRTALDRLIEDPPRS
jgi:beta-phosphoglucomutase-like phosphatase (HAD superfamily)